MAKKKRDFRIGDLVKVEGENIEGWVARLSRTGKILLIERSNDGGWDRDSDVPNTYKARKQNPKFWTIDSEEMIFISRGKVKVKPVNFILKYDLDEDPVEEFETMVEVNARIKRLVDEREDNGLQLDSIFIYEVVNKSQAIIEVKPTIEIKKL